MVLPSYWCVISLCTQDSAGAEMDWLAPLESHSHPDAVGYMSSATHRPLQKSINLACKPEGAVLTLQVHYVIITCSVVNNLYSDTPRWTLFWLFFIYRQNHFVISPSPVSLYIRVHTSTTITLYNMIWRRTEASMDTVPRTNDLG
jgi:hypothetical protein